MIGTCCIVVHSHLPWLLGHGSWPVGEEWLYQAWSQSYLPLVDLLDRLADEGRRNLLTVGVTPVLAAQLDHPDGLRGMHTWLGSWRLRAEELAGRRDPHLRALAEYEFTRAAAALERFEQDWRYGGTVPLRRLAGAGAIELMGGPLTHAFQPLLDERIAAFALSSGLDDHTLRFGRRPTGIWAPECGYRPGLEAMYARTGVQCFMADGPTLREAGRTTAAGWTVGDTDVVVFGRDDELTYRVWSPRSGYPTGAVYRDFHTYDHPSGFKPARVTSTSAPPENKAPYDPEQAAAAAIRDADDFVAAVRRHLYDVAERDARPALAVVAVDTELFGHWWHEGPAFLARVLRMLPEAGVTLTTLSGAIDAGLVAGRVDLGPGSWGAGKDFRVWDGERVADLVALGRAVQHDLLAAARVIPDPPDPLLGRRRELDEHARQALLALSSDWAFMVTNDSAADYARRRAYGHAEAALIAAHSATTGSDTDVAERRTTPDRVFPHLDARLLAAAVLPA